MAKAKRRKTAKKAGRSTRATRATRAKRSNRSGINGSDGKRRPSPQQDELGRFVKGNSGGPGNPNIQALSETRRGLAEALRHFHVADVVRLLQVCLSKGLKGNHVFARLFLEYALGKPKQVTDVNVRGWSVLSKIDEDPQELLKTIMAAEQAAGRANEGAA